MALSQFKSNRPFNYFLLLIYGLILSWSIFLKPSIIDNSTTAFFSTLLIDFLKNIAIHIKISSSFLVVVLLFVQSMLLNQISIKQKLFPKTIYLTGMCFLLFTSLFVQRIELSEALIVSPVLLWVLSKICRLQNVHELKKTLYNIGFVYGIATLIFQPALLFIVVIIFALLLTRPFKLNEYLLLVLGAISPYYFLFCLFILSGWEIEGLLPIIQLNVPHVFFSNWEISALLIISMILLVSIYFIHINMRKLLVQSRNSWTIVFCYFFTSLFVPFFSKSDNLGDWIFVISPLAIISTSFFLYPKQNRIITILYWVLIILSFMIGFYGNGIKLNKF